MSIRNLLFNVGVVGVVWGLSAAVAIMVILSVI